MIEERIDLDEEEATSDEYANFAMNMPIPAGLSTREAEDRTAFLEKLAMGVGPYNAGIGLGWTPYKVDQLLRDDDFLALMHYVEMRKDETVETALYRAAAAGNMQAMQMWLHARRPERWLPTRKLQIESHEQINVNVVMSVREAAKALLADHGPAALQQGGALDRIIDIDEVLDGEPG
jgi:hypothetical protein